MARSASLAGFVLAIYCFFWPGTARGQGAIEAYARLDITGFQLFTDPMGTGIPDQPLINGFNANILSFLSAGTTSANVGPPAGGNSVMASSLNVPRSYEGPAPIPAEDTFTNLATSTPFAHADTAGSGHAIVGLPTPLSTMMVAEVDLRTGNFTDSGSSEATTTYSIGFQVLSPAAVRVLAVVDVSRQLFASRVPSPPGTGAVAFTNFSITISQGAPIFQWTPDGVPGPIVGGTEFADPFALNGDATAPPNAAVGPLNQAGQFRAGVELAPGVTYMLELRQGVHADASSTAVVSFPPGDFDKDTDVDMTDYLILSTNLHTNVSGLNTDQSYMLGDMTKDLLIDGNDFCGFVFAFDDFNGNGAFTAAQGGVPEPSTALLALSDQRRAYAATSHLGPGL